MIRILKVGEEGEGEEKVFFFENFVHELSLKMLNMEEELQVLKLAKVTENSVVGGKNTLKILRKQRIISTRRLKIPKKRKLKSFCHQ